MTAIYLPKPYPDELIYSVIARYFSRAGYRCADATLVSLFGSRTSASFDIPSPLDRLKLRGAGHWHLSTDEILQTLTLFPLCVAFKPEAKKRKFADAIKRGGQAVRFEKISAKASRNGNRQRYLKFCLNCREEDGKAYGETYWRRIHQIPGALFCASHKSPLIESAVQIKHRMDYVDANCAVARKDFCAAKLLPKSIGIAQDVSTRCAEILEGRVTQWPSQRLPAAYRQMALSKGFVSGLSECDTAKLETAFKAFYSEDLLEMMGSVPTHDRPSGWVRNAFRKADRDFSSLEHALIQVFLESCDSRRTHLNTFGNGPWFCPNPYVGHTKPSIKKIEIARHGDKITAFANCRCGLRFSFRELKRNSVNEPKVLQINWFGPEWYKEAIRLRALGRTQTQIQKEMGIPLTAVVRLLRGERPHFQASPQQIDSWKGEWEQLLATVPEGSRHLARQRNPALYKKLRRYASDYLYAKPRRGSKVTKGRLIDWAAMDTKYLDVLKNAEARLRADPESSRRMARSIMTEAQLSHAFYQQIKKMPRCTEFLNSASERQADYYERKLRLVAKRIVESGGVPEAGKVRAKASLVERARGDRFEEVLTEIMSDFSSGGCYASHTSNHLFAASLSK